MSQQAIALALFILEEAIKREPELAAAVRDMLKKSDPTPEEWAALRARVMAQDYAAYVPESALGNGG